MAEPRLAVPTRLHEPRDLQVDVVSVGIVGVRINNHDVIGVVAVKFTRIALPTRSRFRCCARRLKAAVSPNTMASSRRSVEPTATSPLLRLRAA